MLISDNLDRKLNCYIAEILLSHQDLYHLLGTNSTKICSLVTTTDKQYDEHTREPVGIW